MSELHEEITPASPAELSRYLSENACGEKRPVIAVGGRTALGYGNRVIGDGRLVAMSGLSAVMDYPARDQTITVQSGIRISELNRVLAQEGQRLPIDIPDAHRATLGGAVAANTSGPGRYGHGTFRDYVIGISGVDGRGRLFSAGGRVVKNVAGYDICKLLIGSLGTLAAITELTLKLRPVVDQRCVVWLNLNALAEADPVLNRLTSSATRPVAIELFNGLAVKALQVESGLFSTHEGGAIAIVYEGTERECTWQTETLTNELVGLVSTEIKLLDHASSDAAWKAFVEFQAGGDDPATFGASLPPSQINTFMTQASSNGVALQAHAGNGIVIGHLPDHCVSSAAVNEIIKPLRILAEGAGGSVVLWNCDESLKSECSVFGGERPNLRWMRSVKAALDPDNVMSPGRLPF